MFGLGPATRIYVAVGATDMRKGFDGLYGLVRGKLGLEVRSTVIGRCGDPNIRPSCNPQ
jgi:hypothetical protein